MSAVNSLRGPWAIAMYTWREGIRKKTLLGFLILSIFVIFGSTFMTAFVTKADIVEGVATTVETKIIKDICITAISIFGVLITIFISASVVPTEMGNRVIYTVLSKPVRRYQYLFGKFLGVQLIVIANLLLMVGLFFIVLWIKENTLPTMLLWSALLTYFQFLIISAFTFAISCSSTSSVLPTIAGLFIYIGGNLTVYLKDVATRASGSDVMVENLIASLAKLLYNILPNLNDFDLRTQMLNLPINSPPVDAQIPELIIYGSLYALTGYILALWLFHRKEL
jgi:ABC-type transport system involved in multi-copper enzyme maturation permease subunit